MTYNEIITWVTRRLGWKGYSNKLKNDLRFAISMAESELLQETKPSTTTSSLNISDGLAEYGLADHFAIENFNSPHEISVYTNDNVKLAHEEVTYDQWLRFNQASNETQVANDVLPASRNLASVESTAEAAKFSDKVLVAIHYDTELEDYIISIKPSFDGKILLLYSTVQNDDIFANLEALPSMPLKFHQFIIAGAVHKLAQIEAGQAMASEDAGKVLFYQELQKSSFAEFQRGLKLIDRSKGTMDRAVTAKPYTWYNDFRRKSGRV